jgi:phenylacetate-CoA ligase
MNRSRPSILNKTFIEVVNPIRNRKIYWGLGRRIKELQQLEKLSPAEIRDRQWQATSLLLQHAYDSTPFYRERFDRVRIKPADIKSLTDLKALPALTREDIRNNVESLWSRRYLKESLQVAATGGTTDTPVTLLRSQECLRERLAVQMHLDTWAGMWPGDKVFRLWGAQQDFSPDPSWRGRVFDKHVLRNVWAPTSLLNSKVLESYRELLNNFKPGIVYAYPTPLALFCEYLRACGRLYHRPKSVICTAEPLLPEQRELIEQALGCQVFEHYGTRDFGMVGGECEAHQGMHLHPAAVYVEFIPIAGAEVEGLSEILVTDLSNFGMPLIRYRINDCAILHPNPCPCGRGFPLIEKIVGRTTDNFYLPGGSIVPGVALTNRVIQVCPGLKKVQIIQKTLREFHVRYVPGPDFSTSDLQSLKSKLYVFFPAPLRWTFEEVSEIVREQSGKTRFCISYVRAGESETDLKDSLSGSRAARGDNA